MSDLDSSNLDSENVLHSSSALWSLDVLDRPGARPGHVAGVLPDALTPPQSSSCPFVVQLFPPHFLLPKHVQPVLEALSLLLGRSLSILWTTGRFAVYVSLSRLGFILSCLIRDLSVSLELPGLNHSGQETWPLKKELLGSFCHVRPIKLCLQRVSVTPKLSSLGGGPTVWTAL